jgi:alpha-methylacyl-CoA racemase
MVAETILAKGPGRCDMASGPLVGVRIVEFAGLGPAPFCAMLLADMGADVVRIDRPDAPPPGAFSLISRGRRSVALDLKSPVGIHRALALLERADALIEGFRPGVMERLGLGPDCVLARNERLVYGRMTGWGQAGPLAQAAGHDINYISLAGALHAIGPKCKPAIPLNLVGDFGGGSLYLAMGLLAALLHARSTGKGQVVDCAMVDGTASLLTMYYGALAQDEWRDRRECNSLDGGAPFYDSYECGDGNWITIGALEPAFFAELLRRVGIAGEELSQWDRKNWPGLRARLAAVFRSKTCAEWQALLEGSDVCFAPVLSMTDAPQHPHNVARGTFVRMNGVTQPAPAPRFSATPGEIQGPPPNVGAHTEEVFEEWGCKLG